MRSHPMAGAPSPAQALAAGAAHLREDSNHRFTAHRHPSSLCSRPGLWLAPAIIGTKTPVTDLP